MPRELTPAQVRGARGMLDWSMVDLARAARVSVSTVKRIEDGHPVRDEDHVDGRIRGALEAGGVMFLSEGPRRGVLLTGR